MPPINATGAERNTMIDCNARAVQWTEQRGAFEDVEIADRPEVIREQEVELRMVRRLLKRFRIVEQLLNLFGSKRDASLPSAKRGKFCSVMFCHVREISSSVRGKRAAVVASLSVPSHRDKPQRQLLRG